jgi:hypothetical protein
VPFPAPEKTVTFTVTGTEPVLKTATCERSELEARRPKIAALVVIESEAASPPYASPA